MPANWWVTFGAEMNDQSAVRLRYGCSKETWGRCSCWLQRCAPLRLASTVVVCVLSRSYEVVSRASTGFSCSLTLDRGSMRLYWSFEGHSRRGNEGWAYSVNIRSFLIFTRNIVKPSTRKGRRNRWKKIVWVIWTPITLHKVLLTQRSSKYRQRSPRWVNKVVELSRRIFV